MISINRSNKFSWLISCHIGHFKGYLIAKYALLIIEYWSFGINLVVEQYYFVKMYYSAHKEFVSGLILWFKKSPVFFDLYGRKTKKQQLWLVKIASPFWSNFTWHFTSLNALLLLKDSKPPSKRCSQIFLCHINVIASPINRRQIVNCVFNPTSDVGNSHENIRCVGRRC